jgi:ParB-like chromosome segregation protein Spo0J
MSTKLTRKNIGKTTFATPDANNIADTATFHVAPESVTISHETNGRYTPVTEAKVNALAWQIFTYGQMNPVEVNPDNNEIVSGVTRTMAVLAVKKGFPGPDGKTYSKENILLKVTYRKSSTIEALERNIVENFGRNDLNAMDIADNIERLMSAGRPQKKVAELFSFDQPKVSRLRSLNKLPKFAKDLIAAGTLAVLPACELAKPANKLTEDDITAILAKHNNAPTTANVAEFIREREAKKGKKPAATPATPAATAVDTGENDGEDDDKRKRSTNRTFAQTKEYIESNIGETAGARKYTTMIMSAVLEYMCGRNTEDESDAVLTVVEMEMAKLMGLSGK